MSVRDQTGADASVRRSSVTAPGKSMLDCRQAAEFLGAHVETLRRLARRHDIPAFKIGKDWRFRASDLDHWIETHHLRSRKPTILIVDDQAHARNTLRWILERHCYAVSETATGEEALDLLRKTTPDVVLLDLKLSGMDGPAVLTEIRRNHGLLPVIIITAYPDSDLMEQALKYPPLLMLPKPVGSKELLHTIRLALGVRQSPEDTQKKLKRSQLTE